MAKQFALYKFALTHRQRGPGCFYLGKQIWQHTQLGKIFAQLNPLTNWTLKINAADRAKKLWQQEAQEIKTHRMEIREKYLKCLIRQWNTLQSI